MILVKFYIFKVIRALRMGTALSIDELVNEFDSLLDKYLSYVKKRTKGKNTSRQYRSDLQIIMPSDVYDEFLGENVFQSNDDFLIKLSRRMCDRAKSMDSWTEKPISNATKYRRFSVLGAYIKFIYKTYNLGDAPKVPRVKLEKKPRVTLIWSQFKRIDSKIGSERYCDIRDRAIYYLMYYAGIPEGVIVELTADDFDEGFVSYEDKKGWTQTVKLLEFVLDAIDDYKRSYRGRFSSLPESGPFFRSRNNLPLADKDIRRNFEKYARRAKLDVTPMNLIHSFNQGEALRDNKLREAFNPADYTN